MASLSTIEFKTRPCFVSTLSRRDQNRKAATFHMWGTTMSGGGPVAIVEYISGMVATVPAHCICFADCRPEDIELWREKEIEELKRMGEKAYESQSET